MALQAEAPIGADPTGDLNDGALRLDFDRRLMLQFRGSAATSHAGPLAYRELDDALGLTAMSSDVLADAGAGKNGRHDTLEKTTAAILGAPIYPTGVRFLVGRGPIRGMSAKGPEIGSEGGEVRVQAAIDVRRASGLDCVSADKAWRVHSPA